MTLSEIIVKYRMKNNFSQRQFAAKCDVSNGYIAMLERGVNPKTGKPITPTINQLKKISQGMGITLEELFLSVDDIPIYLEKNTTSDPGSGRANEFIKLFERLSEDQQKLIIETIKAILPNQ